MLRIATRGFPWNFAVVGGLDDLNRLERLESVAHSETPTDVVTELTSHGFVRILRLYEGTPESPNRSPGPVRAVKQVEAILDKETPQ